MTEATDTIRPIGFRRIKEGRVDALRTWADAFLRGIVDVIPIVAGQVEGDNGRTFLRMRMNGHVSELEMSFQIGEDPARRAASFLKWHRDDGIAECHGLADHERDPLVERLALAAWATVADGPAYLDAVRASMRTCILYKTGLKRRSAEIEPFGGMKMKTSPSWRDGVPYQSASRARTSIQFISVGEDHRARWRVSDAKLVIPRMTLPDTMLIALRDRPLAAAMDEPLLGRAGATIRTAMQGVAGLELTVTSDLVPLDEAASWIDEIRAERLAA